jgi:hypothetical protein
MWSRFESRFGAILSNLAYHRELVDREAVSVDIADAVARSRLDEERWEKQEGEWRAKKIRTVLSWLSSDDTPPDDVLQRHVHDCVPCASQTRPVMSVRSEVSEILPHLRLEKQPKRKHAFVPERYASRSTIYQRRSYPYAPREPIFAYLYKMSVPEWDLDESIGAMSE